MTSEGASSYTPAEHGVESLVVGAAVPLESKPNIVAAAVKDPQRVEGQNEALIQMAQLNAAALEQAATQQQSEAL